LTIFAGLNMSVLFFTGAFLERARGRNVGEASASIITSCDRKRARAVDVKRTSCFLDTKN